MPTTTTTSAPIDPSAAAAAMDQPGEGLPLQAQAGALVLQLQQACANVPVDQTGPLHRAALEAAQLLAAMAAHIEQIEHERDHPHTASFVQGVMREAAFQRKQWGEDDADKAPEDWRQLLGWLSSKAVAADCAGNVDKALHHTISSAAVLANWHARILADAAAAPAAAAPPAHPAAPPAAARPAS